MKKKILKGLGTLLIIFLITIILNQLFTVIVEARAGGGGSTGGSSSSGGEGNRYDLPALIIAIILYPLTLIKKFITWIEQKYFYTDVDGLELLEYKELFENIQNAWSSGSMKEMQGQMYQSLYDDFQQKLEQYKLSNKRNVVENIQIDTVRISQSSQNKTLKSVLFEGTLIDYFEEFGEEPDDFELIPVKFKDVWIIEKVGEKLIVKKIKNY